MSYERISIDDVLRSAESIRPDHCVDLLADNLPSVASARASRSLIVARGRVRNRALPFGKASRRRPASRTHA